MQSGSSSHKECQQQCKSNISYILAYRVLVYQHQKFLLSWIKITQNIVSSILPRKSPQIPESWGRGRTKWRMGSFDLDLNVPFLFNLWYPGYSKMKVTSRSFRLFLIALYGIKDHFLKLSHYFTVSKCHMTLKVSKICKD